MATSQQSHILLPSLFSLFFIFPFLTQQVHSRTTLHQSCSSSCGDINNIDYPFRLTTDPPGCGDSDYELSCENNKTIFKFHSGKYYVKQISYNNHLIRLVDVNLADGNCSLPYKSSLSLDELTEDGRFRGRVSNTYTSFVNCSSEVSSQSYREVPCLSVNGSFYVYVSYGSYIISELQGPCSFVAMVPTIYQAVMFPSYDNILKLMQAGFDLSWSVECRNCIAAGYHCTVKSWETAYSYKCYSYTAGFHVPEFISFILFAIWDVLVAINLIARFILAPIAIIGFLIHKYRTTKKTVKGGENSPPDQQSLMPRKYSYSEIIAMTNHFKDKLGQGGSGTVYKGQLSDGCLIAVKMLGISKFTDEHFVHEVSTMGRIHHVNVIRLLGFCSEGSYRALLFEYMPNGSLDKYIFSKEAELQPFSWEKLLQIALGTARGIEYLHNGCDECILHFDIKPHNILLDQNFIPKVSDFGIVKFYQDENDFISVSTVRGTMGYIAPELISSNLGAASCKSDVYSFGMLLLEMARCKIYAKGDCSSKVYFPSWLYEHLREEGNLELDNVTEVEAGTARKLCVVGLWCIQNIASDRPSMTKVVEMLEGKIDDLQLPPNSLSFPQYMTNKDAQSDSSTELLISKTMEKSY